LFLPNCSSQIIHDLAGCLLDAVIITVLFNHIL